jgi:ribonuclease HII
VKPTGDPRIDDSKHTVIVGSDEVGIGAWAGPAVICAVAVPRDWTDPRVKDSKKLSEKQREALYEEFWKPEGFPMSVVIVEPSVIDEKGVWPCLIEAHYDATHGMGDRLVDEPLIVVDGKISVKGTIALPKADNLIPAVALASIIAKVTRDRIMVKLDKQYPGYDFSKSKGYGVPKHQAALNKLGPCPAHRRSYEPVARAAANLESPQEDEGWILDDY